MLNINSYILEKLKINSKSKINKTGTFIKLPKIEYTYIELGKTMYNREEKIGCIWPYGRSFYESYIKKFYDGDIYKKFYLIRNNTFSTYNKILDNKIERDQNGSIINIKDFNIRTNKKKNEHHIIKVFENIENNNDRILYIETFSHNKLVSLQYLIIEKETFTRI